MNYICYGSPISAAKEYMDDYLRESEVVYPDVQVLEKGTSFAFLPEEVSRQVEDLYQKATKINSGGDPEQGNSGVIAVVIVAIAAIGGTTMLLTKKKKR